MATQRCPCGFLGHPRKPCHCTPGEVQRYRAKISGPVLDRIDLHIDVQRPPVEQVGRVGDVAEHVQLRERIAAARARQANRYAEIAGVHCNAQAGPQARRTLIRPRREAEMLLRRAMTRWNLSVRAYERTLAVPLGNQSDPQDLLDRRPANGQWLREVPFPESDARGAQSQPLGEGVLREPPVHPPLTDSLSEGPGRRRVTPWKEARFRSGQAEAGKWQRNGVCADSMALQ